MTAALVAVAVLWIAARIATGTFTLLPKRWQGTAPKRTSTSPDLPSSTGTKGDS